MGGVVPAAVDALALVWGGRSLAVILQEGDKGGILLLLLIQPYPAFKNEMHCSENPIYVFPEKKLRGRRPNFHIYVFVRDFILPQLVHIFSCSGIGRPIVEI
jgi:hypothetical protein